MRYRPIPSLCLIEDRSEFATERLVGYLSILHMVLNQNFRPDLPKPPISKHTGSNPVSNWTSKNRNLPSEISTDQHDSQRVHAPNICGAAGSSRPKIPRHSESSPPKFSTSYTSRAPTPSGSDNFEKHHDRSLSHAMHNNISGTTESNIATPVCPTPNSTVNTSPSPVGLDIPMLEIPQIRPAPLNTTLGSPETTLNPASHDVPMSAHSQVNPAIPNSTSGSPETAVVSGSSRADVCCQATSNLTSSNSATASTTPAVTNPHPARSDVPSMHNNKETDARAPPATTVSVVPAPSDNLQSPRSSPLRFPQTPLLRQRKAIRNQTEHLGWFKSTRDGPLLAPPLAIPAHYQVLPRVGDVYMHHDKTTDSFKAWVWRENQWTAATGELSHPILTDYRLKVSSTGEPSWVTKKSLVSEKGRDKRKLWE